MIAEMIAEAPGTTERDYEAFLASKRVTAKPAGFDVADDALNPMLYPFQRHIIRWALKRGRAALFADCGLGKGPMALEWAKHVSAHTGLPVLILAPLAVAQSRISSSAKVRSSAYPSRSAGSRPTCGPV
jgi:hypothetical protein